MITLTADGEIESIFDRHMGLVRTTCRRTLRLKFSDGSVHAIKMSGPTDRTRASEYRHSDFRVYGIRRDRLEDHAKTVEEMVHNKVAALQFEPMRRRLEAGDKLAFGRRISMTIEGIFIDDQFYQWEQIADCGYNSTYNTNKASVKGMIVKDRCRLEIRANIRANTGYCEIASREVDNLPTLVGLARTLMGTNAQ